MEERRWRRRKKGGDRREGVGVRGDQRGERREEGGARKGSSSPPSLWRLRVVFAAHQATTAPAKLKHTNQQAPL